MRVRKKWLIAALIAVPALVIALVVSRFVGSTQDVQVIQPSMREVIELVIASGSLRAKQVSNIGSEVTGIVTSVNVDEGDSVRAGQVLITLQRADAEQQLEQARLAATTAERQLQVVSRGPLPEEVARARAQLAQARRVGQARVAAARQRVRDLQRGRPEERRRAQAQLAQTRAARVQAQNDLVRSRKLAARGAISAQELNRAVTAAQQAVAAEQAAEQAVELAARPASPQTIAAAQADVQAALADYQESTRVAQENLALVLRGARIEDIRLAQARLREAQAAVRLAQEQLAKRTIRSSITGVVTNRNVEPGASVTPSQTLLTITSLTNAQIYVETDETNLPKLRVGQRATIIPPSFPNQPFRATVVQIGPEVNTERGVVVVRLRPVSVPTYLRPDMTLDASIEVAHLPSVISVPSTSLLTQGTRNYVLVVQNGRAIRKNVRVLAQGSQWVGVSGLTSADRVIVNGTEVTPGQRVRVVGGR